MSIDKVRGEHFLEVAPQTTTRACLERMRDEGCPVAVVLEDGKISGVVDAAAIQALVLGQPASWDQPISSVARATLVLAAGSAPAAIEASLHQGLVVVTDGQGKPAKVISRAGWLSYLNITRNTAVFNPLPSSEGASR